MQNSKLFDVLHKFDRTKINNFCEYLNIYNRKSENKAIKLFQVIEKYFPNLDSPELSKIQVHQTLFAEKTFDEKRILNIMSDLLDLVEEYIAYEKSKENTLENKYYLLEFYLENNLNKQFEQTYKLIKSLTDEVGESTDLLAYKLKIEELHIKYQLKYNTRYSDYQQLYNALNDYHISQKYKLDNLCMINLYDDVNKNIVNSKLANIYKKLNTLLLQKEAEIYFQLKAEIIEHQNINLSELRTIIIIMIDYCIKSINIGHFKFNQELLFWYDYLNQLGIILEANNTISSAIIKNYITISIRLKNIENANTFLEKYKSFIDSNEVEDIYNFNKANIYFEQKDYDNALTLLVSIKYKDIFYKVSAKRLYLKIYYELSTNNQKRYFDVFDSALNAYKKYIYTNKELSDDFRERNKNFYKFINKISNLQEYNNQKTNQIESEILAQDVCLDKDWLIDILKKKS
jgi:hypothetical protein